jgi:nucleoside phosphorylase
MTVASDDELVNALWEKRIRWSHAATRMKLRIDRLRLTVLYLSSWGAIAAALTATVLSQSGLLSRIVAAAGAAALAGATYVGAQLLTSEGMRQQIFRFRAIPGTVAQLRAEVEELEQAAEDLLCFLDEAPSVGPAPGPLTPEQYASKRVEGQITNYYRPTARQYRARAQFLRRIAIALGLIATIAASVSAAVSAEATTRIAPWIAVLTTLSGDMTSWSSAISRPPTGYSDCSTTGEQRGPRLIHRDGRNSSTTARTPSPSKTKAGWQSGPTPADRSSKVVSTIGLFDELRVDREMTDRA